MSSGMGSFSCLYEADKNRRAVIVFTNGFTLRKTPFHALSGATRCYGKNHCETWVYHGLPKLPRMFRHP